MKGRFLLFIAKSTRMRVIHIILYVFMPFEMIYSAQCRGFTRKEAMRLIVTGFFQQIFDRITIESVRDALGLAIARRVRDYE